MVSSCDKVDQAVKDDTGGQGWIKLFHVGQVVCLICHNLHINCSKSVHMELCPHKNAELYTF